MAKVVRSALAEQDYRDIWRYIANDNPDAADRLVRRIEAKLQLYASNPGYEYGIAVNSQENEVAYWMNTDAG